jgi:alpha-tubulin suppressor-like RCC1 family protein
VFALTVLVLSLFLPRVAFGAQLMVVSDGTLSHFPAVTGFILNPSDAGIVFSQDGSYRAIRGSPLVWPEQIGGPRPPQVFPGSGFIYGIYADGKVVAYGPVSDPGGVAARITHPPDPVQAQWIQAHPGISSEVVILTVDGTLARWRPGTGAFGLVPDLRDVTAFALGTTHGVALHADGTVSGWSETTLPPLEIPAGLNDVTAVAAGDRFAVALRRNGEVVAWGMAPVQPALGQRVTAIAAAGIHVVALLEDGTVRGWGGNLNQQLNWPSGLRGVVGIGTSRRATALLIGSDLPVLVRQPEDQGLFVGQWFSFQVEVLGSEPVQYQWRFNGRDIPGAVGPVLGGRFEGPRQEGEYSVVVTQANGTVVSRSARLVLIDNLLQEAGTPVPADVPRPIPLNGLDAVAIGTRHTVALKGDGTVACWGGNDLGQCNPPSDLRDVVAIACGDAHTVALRRDGTVVTWGDVAMGLGEVPPDLRSVTAIAAGPRHSLAVLADGTVRAWGDPDVARAPGLDAVQDAVSVAGGLTFSAVLRRNGTVQVFGKPPLDVLQPPADLEGVRAIAAGWYHVAALRENGTVRSWGYGSRGQTNVPAGLGSVVEIAAGFFYTLALRRDGTVAFIGDNVPKPAGTLEHVVSLAAGRDRTAFVLRPPQAPYLLRSLEGRSVLAGEEFELSVEVGGTPPFRYVWYRNGFNYSTLPTLRLTADALTAGHYLVVVSNDHGVTATPEVPVEVLGIPAGRTVGWGRFLGFAVRPTFELDNVRSLSLGSNFMVALRQDGTVVARGATNVGQTNVPAELGRATAVAAGDAHGLALRADGTVVAWGDNSRGQCDVPAGLTDAVAIGAGWFHSLAVRSDGTVVGWGQNTQGQAQPPPGLRDVIAVAGGSDFSVALRRHGRLVAWGSDAYGQTTGVLRAPLARRVVAGAQHGLVLTADGTVWGWGRNDSGQVPAGLWGSGVQSVAAGENYSLAVTADRGVMIWGGDRSGPTAIPTTLRDPVAIYAGRHQAVAVLATPRPVLRLESVGDRLDLTSWVSPGWWYQYEQSLDLETWTPAGMPFQAPTPTLTDPVGRGATKAFFRLRPLPE